MPYLTEVGDHLRIGQEQLCGLVSARTTTVMSRRESMNLYDELKMTKIEKAVKMRSDIPEFKQAGSTDGFRKEAE